MMVRRKFRQWKSPPEASNVVSSWNIPKANHLIFT